MAQNKRRKMDVSAAWSSVDNGEPQIAEQTAVANDTPGSTNKKKVIFNEDKDDFREAVKWTGFVDRSNLIEELMSEPRIVIIFAPTRFGKSMNVDMVKCFFEIEKGRNVIEAPQNLKELNNLENFKAFNRYGLGEPCQILNEESLVKEHFGRHPVVHLNFRCFNVSSIEEVDNSLKKVVHDAYREHSYLTSTKIFSDGKANQDANEYCEDWCHPRKYKNEDAKEGLAYLIEFLHEYHKRKVYLLVDEFDAPIVDALLGKKSTDEVTKINREITKLLGAVVKGEVEKQHLLGSLITGVSYLGGVGISEHLNNVPVYKWLLDNRGRFVSYYGLSDEELTTILKNVFPKDDEKQKSIQKEVKKFYSGYNFKNQSVYSLWSVLHYIDLRSEMDASEIEITKKSFWGRSSIITKMGSLLKHTEFMDAAIKLMDIKGDGISFSPCDKVDTQTLAMFLNGDEKFKKFNVAFSFLMEQGYLTRDYDRCSTSGNDKGTIYVKIPNVDILVAFEEMFQNFCIEVYGFSESKMGECANVFANFPKETDDVIFKQKLKEFYDRLRSLLQHFGTMDHVNERSLQSVLFTVMLKTGLNINLEKIVKGDSSFGKIDIFWIYGTFLGIMELKVEESDNDDSCKESARQALEEILTGGKNKKVPYVKVLEKYPDVKNYLLIGLCMNKKGTPHMCCLVNSRNPKDCITYIPKDD